MENDSRVKVWRGNVLTVPNHHIEMCGKPPELVAKGCYTAYFENQYGEQLVFQYDYKAKKGTLWCGDYSWEQPVPVMGGGTTIVLGSEEQEWLRLAWQVATRHETKEFQLRSRLDLISAHKAICDDLINHSELAKSASMRRSYSMMKKKLEKEERAILEELEKLRGVEEAEKIIRGKEGGT